MSCWASTTVEALPLHLEQERRLDDVDADAAGRPRPASTSSDLISVDRVGHQPDRRRDGAAEAEEAGPVVLLRHPRGVLLVVLDRRAEVPQHRVLAAGQQRVADHLVAERAADPGLRRVADVVEVEQQERAALAGLQRRPGPAEPVVAAAGRSRPAPRSRRPCGRARPAGRGRVLSAPRSVRGAEPVVDGRRPRASSSSRSAAACSSSRIGEVLVDAAAAHGRPARAAAAAAATGIGTSSSSGGARGRGRSPCAAGPG